MQDDASPGRTKMEALLAEQFIKSEHLKARIRSRSFFWVLFSLPPVCYLLGRLFEHEITLAIIPVFPHESDKGFVFYLDFVQLCLNELLWLWLFFVVAWWLVATPGRLTKNIFTISRVQFLAVAVIAIFFFLAVTVSKLALDAFPNSSDEYAYITQAKTLSEGKLATPAPSFPEALYSNHIAIKDGIRVGRFPPGWPLFLSLSYAMGIPTWLFNPIIGTLSLILIYFFARRFYGEEVALWSIIVTGISGFFMFNAASFFSHTSCALAALGFVWGFKLFDQTGRAKYLLLAGFSLGLVAIIRYYTAVLIVIPFACYILYQYRGKLFSVAGWIFAGSLPCIAFLFWYNYSLTGNALMPVTVWAYDDEQLGFVKGHTFFKGIEHIIRRLFMFMYWCSPGILVIYFVLVVKKLKSSVARWKHPEDYLFIVLLLGHFIYYQIGGNQYGPRFLLETFPFLVLFVVRNVLTRCSPGLMALFLVSIIFQMAKLPSIADREARIVEQRQDLYHQVEQKGISKAVVVISAPTSSIRPMPIGDLTRNNEDFNDNVLYVKNSPDLPQLLRSYGGRKIYEYIRSPDDEHGKLKRIR